MNHTKRVAEATTSCANKENNQPLISESSPLNQRDINQNSMVGKNGIPPIMDNIITRGVNLLVGSPDNPSSSSGKT